MTAKRAIRGSVMWLLDSGLPAFALRAKADVPEWRETGRGRVQPVPAAVLCRRRAGLRVRARRARFRADLQGDRDGQLRAGRPDDARRLLRADREHHPGLAVLGDDPVRHRGDGGGRHADRAHRDPPGARLSDLHGGDDHDRRRLRAARRRHHGAGLGHRDLFAENPVRRLGAARRRRGDRGRSAGDHRPDRGAVSRALSLLPLRQARRRHAGDLAEPARRLLHGHPGAAREHADLGARGRGRGVRRHPARADRVRAFQHGLHRAEGVSRRGGRRLRQRAGRGGRRADHRRGRGDGRLLSRRRAGRTSRPTWSCCSCCGSCRPGFSARRYARRCEASSMRFIFKTDYDQDIRLFQHGGQMFWYGLLGLLLLAAPFLSERIRPLAAAFHLHLRDRRFRA